MSQSDLATASAAALAALIREKRVSAAEVVEDIGHLAKLLASPQP